MTAACSSKMYVCFLLFNRVCIYLSYIYLNFQVHFQVQLYQHKKTHSIFVLIRCCFLKIAMFCKKKRYKPPCFFSETTQGLRWELKNQTPRRNATMCVVVKRMRPSRAWDVIDPWKNRFRKRHMQNKWFPKTRMEINMDFYRRNSLENEEYICKSFLGTWGLQRKQVSGIKQLTQIT